MKTDDAAAHAADAIQVPELQPTEPTQEPKSSIGRWKLWLGVVLVLLVVIGAIGTAVGVTQSGKSSGPTAPGLGGLGPTQSPTVETTSPSAIPTEIPTPSPSVNPTLPPSATVNPTWAPSSFPSMSPTVTGFRFQVVRTRLVGDVAPLDESSVQFRALEWLAYDDPAMLPVNTTPLTALMERYVMALLYFATNGENWINQNQFLTNSSVCSWGGVLCGDQNTVTEIQLPGNNLNGSIPAELGELDDLKNVNIGSQWLSIIERIDNQLTGTIPTELGRLTELTRLVLRDNQLTGTIPTEFGQLTQLTSLDLWGNRQLNGTLPSELGNLSNINTFLITFTSISGTIPTEFQSWLPSIKVITLHATNITGDLSPVFCGSTNAITNFWADCNGGVVCDCCTFCCKPGGRLCLEA